MEILLIYEYIYPNYTFWNFVINYRVIWGKCDQEEQVENKSEVENYPNTENLILRPKILSWDWQE